MPLRPCPFRAFAAAGHRQNGAEIELAHTACDDERISWGLLLPLSLARLMTRFLTVCPGQAAGAGTRLLNTQNTRIHSPRVPEDALEKWERWGEMGAKWGRMGAKWGRNGGEMGNHHKITIGIA